MKETGIIMSRDHPRKILDGTETMTRRTWGLEWINLAPAAWEFLRMEGDKGVFKLIIGSDLPSVYAQLANVPRGSYPLIKGESPNLEFYIKCPYGGVGDKLWVRETFAYESPDGERTVTVIPNVTKIFYQATDDWEGVRVPSIHMPRWASRIERIITGRRAERLQEITMMDARAEGSNFAPNYIEAFHELWDSLNAKRGYGWEVNPWVWPISW